MITSDTKNLVIARLKMAIPLEEISAELEIPLPLIKEWESKLDPNDLVQLKANVHAVNNLSQDVMISSTESNEKLLQAKLEECAIQIAGEIVRTGAEEVVVAKTLQLLADTTSKLYNTFINKGPNHGLNEGGNAMSLFDSLRRD